MKPEDFRASATRPFTGEEYLASLRDDREIYIYGDRVKDVTSHPAFRNAAASMARLYDALHDPQSKEKLCWETDTGNGGYTHKFFRYARSADELRQQRDAIAEWSRLTYGWMGRTPDYKAAFGSALGANPGFYGRFEDNAKTWYKRIQEACLYLNHAIVNPPIDRDKPVDQVKDVFISVDEEVDGGIVVSGAKVVATNSALTHYNFVGQGSAQLLGDNTDFALMFIAPMNTPGMKLICRPSYELVAGIAGSPFDYPLTSRFDENDSVLLFDKALIPWEDVLVYRDLRRATGFYAESGFANLYNFQSGIRLGVKLELMIGLLSLGVRANGTQGFRGIQAALGELIALQHLLQALTTAMARDPERNAAGSAVPRLEYANALRIQVPQIWKRVRELLESALGGAPLVTVSGAADLRDGEARRLVDSYYRGAELEPEQRLKLFKLIWDATGSEFGARHAVYESHYSGNAEQIRLDSLAWASRRGHLAYCEAMVQRCMADYDIHGWLRGPWQHD